MFKISDIVHQLFSYLNPDRLTSFSCGHIIPASNLQTLVVSKGPRGGELEYKAGKQGDASVVSVPRYFDLASLVTPHLQDRRAWSDLVKHCEYSACGDGGIFPVVQLPQHLQNGLAKKWNAG